MSSPENSSDCWVCDTANFLVNAFKAVTGMKRLEERQIDDAFINDILDRNGCIITVPFFLFLGMVAGVAATKVTDSTTAGFAAGVGAVLAVLQLNSVYRASEYDEEMREIDEFNEEMEKARLSREDAPRPD